MVADITGQPPRSVSAPADWLDELLGDYRDRSLIAINKLPGMLPPLRADRPINVATMYRWMTDGCRGVKLRYMTIGSRRYTKPEWLREFFAAQNGGSATNALAPASEPPPAPSSRSDRDIDRRLDAYMGPKTGKPARARRAVAAK